MARYRQKDDIDLGWNNVRRRITRELDLQIAEVRERMLNDLLGAAWNQYKASLAKGEILALEPKYETFVAQVLTDAIDVQVEGPTSEAA
jgi:hypothetical protein